MDGKGSGGPPSAAQQPPKKTGVGPGPSSATTANVTPAPAPTAAAPVTAPAAQNAAPPATLVVAPDPATWYHSRPRFLFLFFFSWFASLLSRSRVTTDRPAEFDRLLRAFVEQHDEQHEHEEKELGSGNGAADFVQFLLQCVLHVACSQYKDAAAASAAAAQLVTMIKK